MKRLTSVLALVSLATLAAPALAADPAAKPAAADKPAAAAPAPAKIDWKAMSKAERKAYMKKTVMPEMKKLFVEFDAKHYKKMNCMTCHGSGANKDFKMPNPELPKLPTDEAGFKALAEKKPEAAKFMGTKVKPTMAALLNLPEWTPQNTSGFGCYGCHEADKGAAAAPAPAAPAAAPAAAPKPAK